MLSSLQGGRKETPLAVRKEAYFNKALLSLEKGKQAEKHILPTTVVLTQASCFNFCKNYAKEDKLLNCSRNKTSWITKMQICSGRDLTICTFQQYRRSQGLSVPDKQYTLTNI